MPVTHVTKVFAVTDCKIAKMLTDPAGGSATYSASVDVPGIKSLAISGSVNTQTLRGDNQLLDSDTVLQDASVTVAHAKLSYDVLAVLFGVTVVDAGTTPSQTATFDLLGSSKPGYFKVSGISASSDVLTGNVQFVLHKCIMSSFPELGLAEETYQTTSFQAAAIPLLANGKWITSVLSETAAVLA